MGDKAWLPGRVYCFPELRFRGETFKNPMNNAHPISPRTFALCLAFLTGSSFLLWLQTEPINSKGFAANKTLASAAFPKSAVDAPAAVAIQAANESLALLPVQAPGAQDPAMVALLAERKHQMLGLLKADPAAALQLALPKEVRAKLPAAWQELIETPFSQTVGWERYADCHGGTEGSAWVTWGEHRCQVTPHGRWLGVTTKRAVAAHGIHLDGWAAVAAEIFETAPHGGKGRILAGGSEYSFRSESEASEVERALQHAESLPSPENGSGTLLAAYGGVDQPSETIFKASKLAASAWTETPKKVLLIPVDFSDKPGPPVNLGTLSSIMNTKVRQQIEAMSYGKTTLNITIFNVVRLPSPTTTYLPSDTNLLLNNSRAAAAAAGAVLADYDIVGTVFAELNMTINGGAFTGYASIGGGNLWIQASTDPVLISHEIGHNYGLNHASRWVTTDGSYVGAGTNSEYGDSFDILGSGGIPGGHFGSFGKARLNWLPAANAPTVTTSGIYRLHSIDHAAATTGVRGLRIDRGTGGGAYWLSFRREQSQANIKEGIALNWEKPSTNRTWLVDTVPDTAAADGVALGRTYSDTTANIHFSPLSVGGSGAGEYIDVAIQLGSFPGNTGPSGTLSGPSTLAARTSALFTADMTDPDGDALSYFWEFGDGEVVSNAPTISKSWEIGGTYSVKVTVTDRKGGSFSQTQSITVTDNASTWFTRTSGTTGHLRGVAANATTAVAVGGNAVVRTSTDGSTWTTRTLPGGGNVYPKAVAWTGSKFVLVGEDYDFTLATWRGVIYSSASGTTWTRDFFGAWQLEAVAGGGGLIVASGRNGVILTASNSMGALTWTQQTSGTTHWLEGVAYLTPHHYVVGYSVGAGLANGDTVVLRSTDGLAWTNLGGNVTIDSWRDYRTLANLNGNLVASGFNAGLHVSRDAAANWTSVAPVTVEAQGLAYGNGVYLAAGGGSSGPMDLYASEVSMRKPWSTVAPGTVPTRQAATFFKNTFITVGNDGSIRQSAVISAPQGFPYWQAAMQASAPQALSGPHEDADGDGFTNLVEYAAGTNALLPTQAPALVSTTQGGSSELSLNFAQKPADVMVVGETSEDLVQWLPTGYTVVTDTPANYTIRLTRTPLRKFLRIKVLTGEF